MDAPSSCACAPAVAAAAAADAPGKAGYSQNEESSLSSSSSFHAAATKLAQQKQHHPLLRRHYFSIGIGDCFVIPPPAHLPLPSVYLSSPATARTPPFADDHVGNIDDASNKQQKQQQHSTTTFFESTELVAAIKSTPQDFVVREIGLLVDHHHNGRARRRSIWGLNPEQVKAMMRVASLDGLPNCCSHDPPTLARRMQAVGSLLVDEKDDEKGMDACNDDEDGRQHILDNETLAVAESTSSRETSRQHDVVRMPRGNMQQQQQKQTRCSVQPADGQSKDDSKSPPTAVLDPMSTLQKFLPRQSVESSTTSTTTKSASSLNDLARLQADAVEWIQTRACGSSINSSNDQTTVVPRGNNHNKYDDDTNHHVSSRSVVIRPLLSSFDPESTSARMERGEFHTALRLAFPLLKVESAETKSSTSSSSLSLCIVDEASRHYYYDVKVIVDDSFFALVPFLYEPHVDIPRLYQFLRNKRHDRDTDEPHDSLQPGQSQKKSNTRNGNSNNIDNQSRLYLRLRPNLARSERRPVHQIIDTKSGRSLATETLPSYPLHPDKQGPCAQETAAIVVSWSKTAQRRAAVAACKKNQSKKRKRGGTPPPPMTSENGDNTANDVATSTDVDHYPNLLFILKKTQVEHLAAIQLLSRALHCRQPDIGLSGIKDMQAVTYQFCTIRNGAAAATSYNIRKQARDFLQSRGVEISQNVYHVDWFLHKGALHGNRFEIVLRNVRRIRVSQRTASAATATEESSFPCDAEYIQKAVKRIKSYGILNYYGEQRVGAAGEKAIVGTRALDIGRALLQQDYAKAIDLIMIGRLLCKGGTEREHDEVRLVRQTWKDSGGDPFVTWKKLPPCESSLLLRERLVLRGLKRYGKSEPLAALKCLQYNERVFWIQAYQSYVFNRAVTERVQRYGMQVVAGDLVRSRHHPGHVSGSDGELPEVIVTQDNLSEYSIEDVLLPLPGYNIVYPTNEVGRLYQAILEADRIVFRKDALPETTAKGSYRYLKASVTNVKSEILNRDDSGLDLRIGFDLPAGSYATMVLRELMRTTVSRSIGDFIMTRRSTEHIE